MAQPVYASGTYAATPMFVITLCIEESRKLGGKARYLGDGDGAGAEI